MAAKNKLELTWIGKDIRPRLEPRILIEEPELSYHAKARRDGDIFDNLLIHGDNLLALKALETDPTVRGKVKCVYIDPPFNTGAAFDHYDDGLEHSVWLSLMFERVQIIHSLLSETGVLFVHLDDNELDYMKIILDQVFGRANFVNRITIDARAPSAFSTVNPGVFKASEYILWYAKDRSIFEEGSGRVPREPDYAYNKWIINPDEDFSAWRFSTIMEAYDKQTKPRSRHPRTILEHFNSFMVDNAARICRLASISDTGAGEAIVSLKQESLKSPGKIFRLQRGKGLDDVYVLDGQQLIFYSKNISVIDGQPKATKLLTNIWTDIAWEGIANEGGVKFKKGKKPEKLIRRCIELSTRPGDLVLDSFAGSGTTGAVAHKMGRRWIMVELGDHAQTHIVPRIRKVIDGTDSSGVTEAVGWKGGGGYRFARLAPSLLEKDAWGNWVIRKEYNPAMLAEAMCKHFNYTYAPSTEHFWLHGHSSETSYIYVTTNSLTGEQLRALSDEHLCLSSRSDWAPEAVLRDEGVGEDDEFAHDGDENDLRSLAGFPEAFCEGGEIGIVAAGRERRHVGGVPDGAAAAPDAAEAAAAAAVVGDGRDAGERGGLLGRAGAELGQSGEEDGCRDGSDARDRAQDGMAAGHVRVGQDAPFDLGVEPFDMALAGVAAPAQLGLEEGDGGRRQPVGERGALRRGGAARIDQFAHLLQGGRRRRRPGRLEGRAHHRQQPGVDRVGLGERAGRLGEQPGAQRVDHRHHQACRMQRAPCRPVMLAGRLHDDAGDRKGREHPLQPFQADAVVAHAKRLAGRMDMHVQPLFTHVDTGIDWRRVRFGHCLALHAGLAPHHLFRTSAKDERTKLIRGPQAQGAHGPVRPIPGGWPSAGDRSDLPTDAAQTTCKVGENRSLLICCKAFEEQSARSLSNLTIRKIPGAVLDRCEWGKDDYSLKIESLPMMQEDEDDDLPLAPKPGGKKDAATGDLFADEAEG